MSAVTPLMLSQFEALLYVSGEALTRKKLQALLSVSSDQLNLLVAGLRERYTEAASGLTLIEHGGAIEIATQPQHAELLERFTKSFLQEHLSKAALEVLAIVAYRGPITRAALEAIRGVNCSFTLRTLLLRGLITREDNADDHREYVYVTSLSLLEKLGLGSEKELPDFETLSHDVRIQEAAAQGSQNTEIESQSLSPSTSPL